jgi:hypothetical protein
MFFSHVFLDSWKVLLSNMWICWGTRNLCYLQADLSYWSRCQWNSRVRRVLLVFTKPSIDSRIQWDFAFSQFSYIFFLVIVDWRKQNVLHSKKKNDLDKNFDIKNNQDSKSQSFWKGRSCQLSINWFSHFRNKKTVKMVKISVHVAIEQNLFFLSRNPWKDATSFFLVISSKLQSDQQNPPFISLLSSW